MYAWGMSDISRLLYFGGIKKVCRPGLKLGYVKADEI